MNIKINEAIVHDICLKLVEHDGAMIKVYDEMKTGIVSYNIIKQIKYKNSWTDISDKYFNKDSFKKRSTHYISDKTVELICELLLKHNGSTARVVKEFKNSRYRVTSDQVQNIKSENSHRFIYQLHHAIRVYPMMDNETYNIIMRTLKKCDNKVYKAFNMLSDEYPCIKYIDIVSVRFSREYIWSLPVTHKDFC